jgi:ATP-dependent Clp protease ATP-binding subunit ClpA
MFERFSTSARKVVLRARQEARELRQPYIGPEHLLLALLEDQDGIAYAVLHEAGVDRERVRADVQRLGGTPSKVLGEDDAAALRTIGIDLDAVLARIEESLGPDALEPIPPAGRRGLLSRIRRRSQGPVEGEFGAVTGEKQGGATRFTPRAKKVIGLALREAVRLGSDGIGTEHILLGLIRDGDALVAKVLNEAGVTLDDLRTATLAAMPKAG